VDRIDDLFHRQYVYLDLMYLAVPLEVSTNGRAPRGRAIRGFRPQAAPPLTDRLRFSWRPYYPSRENTF